METKKLETFFVSDYLKLKCCHFTNFNATWKIRDWLFHPETFGLRNLLFVIRYSDICSWTTLLLRHMVFDISSLFYLPLRLLLFWFLKMPKTTLLLRHLLFKTFAIQDICFSDICYSDICSSVLQSLFWSLYMLFPCKLHQTMFFC